MTGVQTCALPIYDVLREEVLTRVELIKSFNVPDPAKLYDYSIIRRIYADLRKGWKPKL